MVFIKVDESKRKIRSEFLSDIFRPTVKVSKDTPTTFKELTPQEIEKARREKYLKGRVKKFKV